MQRQRADKTPLLTITDPLTVSRNNTPSDAPISMRRLWLAPALRWLLSILIIGIVAFSQPAPDAALGGALGIAFVLNCIITLLWVIHAGGQLLVPALSFSDGVIAFLFIPLAANPLDQMAIGVLMLTGVLLRSRGAGAGVHALAILIGAAAVDSMTTLTPLIPVAITVVGASILLGREVLLLRDYSDRLTSRYEEQQRTQISRTQALSDLTFTMSSTLNYMKVLEATLAASSLVMRPDAQDRADIVAGIFLYHIDDGMLHPVCSRRFTRADDTRVLPGKQGIIGQALRDAAPVIGANAGDDPELQVFVGFQKCQSVLCIPLRAGFETFGVIVFGSDLQGAFRIEQEELLKAFSLQATIALQNAVLYSSLLEEKERIITVDEEERRKLARELHDGPTQMVAAITMRAGYIRKLHQKRPDDVPAELEKIEEIARKATHEIRHMLFTLRPLVLETQGLSAALNQLVEKMYELSQQSVAIRIASAIESLLSSHQQAIVFSVIEEAVNNARKHARAKLITVSIRQQSGFALVEIADNGVGFDVNKVISNYEGRGSLGMINLRERAELLDATINVESVIGKGTVITMVVPLKPVEAEEQRDTLLTPKTRLAVAAAKRVDRAAGRMTFGHLG